MSGVIFLHALDSHWKSQSHSACHLPERRIPTGGLPSSTAVGSNFDEKRFSRYHDHLGHGIAATCHKASYGNFFPHSPPTFCYQEYASAVQAIVTQLQTYSTARVANGFGSTAHPIQRQTAALPHSLRCLRRSFHENSILVAILRHPVHPEIPAASELVEYILVAV